MKKNYNPLHKISGFIILVTILLLTPFAQAQELNAQQADVVVSYNSDFTYYVKEDATWSITTESGQSYKNGTGSILNERFSTPGNYYLQVSQTDAAHSCSSAHSLTQKIAVTPVRMEFDFSTIEFSKKIVGGHSTQGTLLRVHVFYESYEQTSVPYNFDCTTAGVGTNIKGTLRHGPVTLQPGNNVLEFVLEGQATSGNYIIFDFVDLNGNVKSYGLTQIIE